MLPILIEILVQKSVFPCIVKTMELTLGGSTQVLIKKMVLKGGQRMRIYYTMVNTVRLVLLSQIISTRQGAPQLTTFHSTVRIPLPLTNVMHQTTKFNANFIIT